MIAKKLNHRQAHWSLHLARFDFLLHHPGHTMGKLDALSRRADHRNGALDNENIVLLWLEFLAVHALEEVELAGVEQKILSDIHKGNRNGDQEEPIAKAAWELWSSANKAIYFSEWLNIDGLLWFQGKIYVLWSPDLYRQIVALCYDTQIAGHPGCWKTLELVSWNYWWPQMSRYISQYVSTCNLCLQTWCHHDSRGCCLQKSVLHSNAHDSHSGRSSQTLSPLCLKTPQSPKTRRLWPRISIRSFIH